MRQETEHAQPVLQRHQHNVFFTEGRIDCARGRAGAVGPAVQEDHDRLFGRRVEAVRAQFEIEAIFGTRFGNGFIPAIAVLQAPRRTVFLEAHARPGDHVLWRLPA